MDDIRVRAIPDWESGIGTSRDVPEGGAGDDPKEGMIHLLKVRLEVVLYVDDESGCDR